MEQTTPDRPGGAASGQQHPCDHGRSYGSISGCLRAARNDLQVRALTGTPAEPSAAQWEESDALLSATNSGPELADYGQVGGDPRRAGGEERWTRPNTYWWRLDTEMVYKWAAVSRHPSASTLTLRRWISTDAARVVIRSHTARIQRPAAVAKSRVSATVVAPKLDVGIAWVVAARPRWEKQAMGAVVVAIVGASAYYVFEPSVPSWAVSFSDLWTRRVNGLSDDPGTAEAVLTVDNKAKPDAATRLEPSKIDERELPLKPAGASTPAPQERCVDTIQSLGRFDEARTSVHGQNCSRSDAGGDDIRAANTTPSINDNADPVIDAVATIGGGEVTTAQTMSAQPADSSLQDMAAQVAELAD